MITPPKRKGSNAEREVAKILAAAGLTEAVRMPLSGAVADFPGDVRINGYCAEVKRTERFDLWGAWRQVCAAARGGRTPIVFNRRNNSPWLATMEMAHWAAMEAELREYRRREDEGERRADLAAEKADRDLKTLEAEEVA